MNTNEKHAVVLGGSLAGLLAARVLADHFEPVGYASRLYRIPETFNGDWKCAYVQSAPPERKRGAILFSVEGNRIVFTCRQVHGLYRSVKIDLYRSVRSVAHSKTAHWRQHENTN